MKRSITIALLVCACDQKNDEQVQPPTCLEYATELIGRCFDTVRYADERTELQCDSGLLEAGYNACNISLESGQPVRIPFRTADRYVMPPAPANWRGVDVQAPEDREREP